MFGFQNYQLYKISRIDAGKKPVLYKLSDMLDAPIPGYYYATQLTRTEKGPEPETFFRVEKILRTKWEKGKKKFLVKFLHYPPKFNRWLLKSDFAE